MTTTLDKNILNRKGFDLDESGRLMFDECSLEELSHNYGTPLYVFSESIIREKCREYTSAFKECNIDFEVLYAGKAFLVQSMCRILQGEGFGLDVSSGGEIYTALSAGFPGERIYFHGNNKSEEELRFAIKENVGTIIIDNLYELQLVDQIANELNKKVNIMVRIIPGVDTHTHEKIRTGQVDSKFGIPIRDFLEVFPQIIKKDHLIYQGIHCHIGSQLFDIQFYHLATKEMIGMIKDIETKYQVKTNMLNLGGGLGVRYTDKDSPPSINDYIHQLVEKVKEVCSEKNLAIPQILVEPGRSIVAEAGITLYRIGAIKEIKGLKKYLIVDGGMADNPRPSLYDAQYEALIVNKFNQKPVETVTIGGKYCESGDILIENIQLPEAESGDLMVFFSTGAYHHSMSNNYNGIPRPPVVLVNQGKHALMVKGETYQDLNQNHVFPAWLA
ncbi:MAG: diaminopimelate decarboxylase [Atribacterota bacterium]